MNPAKIERINELAHKKKSVGLTEEEAAEQAALRQDGSRHALTQKDELPLQ